MTTVLNLFAVAVLWAASLVVHPFGKCFWCGGRRVRVRGGRARRCRLCGGAGRRQRFGSKTAHRIRRQMSAHWRGSR